MDIDFPTVASIFWVITVTMSSNSLQTRKFFALIFGNLLFIRSRSHRARGDIVKANHYSRAGYIVFMTGLSYNWFYDSIGFAGFLLGILGIDGHELFIALYHALALTRAEGLMIPARMVMSMSLLATHVEKRLKLPN
jgi:hypothetical protein